MWRRRTVTERRWLDRSTEPNEHTPPQGLVGVADTFRGLMHPPHHEYFRSLSSFRFKRFEDDNSFRILLWPFSITTCWTCQTSHSSALSGSQPDGRGHDGPSDHNMSLGHVTGFYGREFSTSPITRHRDVPTELDGRMVFAELDGEELPAELSSGDAEMSLGESAQVTPLLVGEDHTGSSSKGKETANVQRDADWLPPQGEMGSTSHSSARELRRKQLEAIPSGRADNVEAEDSIPEAS